VRKWAYELRDLDLLAFGPGFEKDKAKKKPPVRSPGHRNDRNVFYLRKFEERLEGELEVRDEEKRKRREKPS
jgi:hypothetical protein